MSDGAPTKNTIRKTIATVTDKCNIEIPGMCIAAEKGPVHVFFYTDKDNQQLHVCVKCFEQLILSGQWVEEGVTAGLTPGYCEASCPRCSGFCARTIMDHVPFPHTCYRCGRNF